MNRHLVSIAIVILFGATISLGAKTSQLDRLLDNENQKIGVSEKPLPVVNDLAFLRRISIDLIGRIPTQDEVNEFLNWSSTTRRTQAIDKLMTDDRFVDRWTIFFADLLRLRSNRESGAAALAFVHKSLQDNMPYDELARRLISATGKAGVVPEVAFILGDNADPMALAGVTSQTFLGIRIACAQCHDHPFDVWTQKDFYGLAAYFGKTRRVESQFTRTVYTTEVQQSTVLWPPAGSDEPRKPMLATFPFTADKADRVSKPIARLRQLRNELVATVLKNKPDSSESDLDDLLDDAAAKADDRSKGRDADQVGAVKDAQNAVRSINLKSAFYTQSDLRVRLAKLVTDPKNRYFSRSFVNRVWSELVGRGFVNPVDDFTESNLPSHPQTLDYLADEFVASGFQLKPLVRMIVTSQTYQRQHAVGVDDLAQMEMEKAFLATPMRRMVSEVLFDSIVVAGHLFDIKHEPGMNMKVVWRESRIAKEPKEKNSLGTTKLTQGKTTRNMKAMVKKATTARGYDLEKSIELDFDALLNAKKDDVKFEKMRVMSKEEIEAMRMAQEAQQRRVFVEYIDQFTKTVSDDNPKFNTAMRMASPANPEHFLRVFGQTSRAQLGEKRDHSPTMRQALMMLNGRLAHEASRVGTMEPIHPLLVGKKANLTKAITLAYLEILTREPSAEEIADAKEIVQGSDSKLNGIADLRWILLNCNEFRFLP